MAAKVSEIRIIQVSIYYKSRRLFYMERIACIGLYKSTLFRRGEVAVSLLLANTPVALSNDISTLSIEIHISARRKEETSTHSLVN